ncbi:hypothetical protein AbraIFM66950_008944 [Aspergillus brasiliensis]|nr:hypothetical protein AbraIFM66950_008944 [Aspergillus brasiliensis]
MNNGQVPCSRCRKRGLPCTVNRSLQMLLEDDAGWKGVMSHKVRWLEHSMSQVLSRLDPPAITTSFSVDPAAIPPPGGERLPPSTAWEVVMNPQSGPAAIPAACVSEVAGTTPSARLPSINRMDLISRGVVSHPEAMSLFELYSSRLDHFLYRILGDHNSLESVRDASPILTAAICAVAALHSLSLGNRFDACYQEYKELIALHMLSTKVNADDVRGLCIGAFWLPEISWSAIATAVRMASDIKLHCGIYPALRGDRRGYLQARLYYLLYVCDHHFSIAYGRLPMSREGSIIGLADRFLRSDHATENDARLISQVKMWSVMGEVLDTFGGDLDSALPPPALPQLRRYSIALETWCADWSEAFRQNENVGNYPQKGVGFHFHFAKLYLCSHAFRGVPAASGLDPELEEIANAGVLSAMAILRMLVADGEFQSFLNGLPLYFDTMIAFAVIFLLKVASKHASAIGIDTAQILSLVSHTVTVLRQVTRSMHQQHLLVNIARGLQTILDRRQEPGSRDEPPGPLSPSVDGARLRVETGCMEGMASFDFLTTTLDLDEWLLH